MLCMRCNRGLGQFHDDINIVRRAVAYLQHPPSEKMAP
jgi:hypothetical protein